jgi:hypothetical protein
VGGFVVTSERPGDALLLPAASSCLLLLLTVVCVVAIRVDDSIMPMCVKGHKQRQNLGVGRSEQ